MARKIRSYQLETRTQRLKLAIRRKPYTVRVAPGIRLGYRRNATSGTWSVLGADGQGGSWLRRLALADDHDCLVNAFEKTPFFGFVLPTRNYKLNYV